jgi:hypothetical protein
LRLRRVEETGLTALLALATTARSRPEPEAVPVVCAVIRGNFRPGVSARRAIWTDAWIVRAVTVRFFVADHLSRSTSHPRRVLVAPVGCWHVMTNHTSSNENGAPRSARETPVRTTMRSAVTGAPWACPGHTSRIPRPVLPFPRGSRPHGIRAPRCAGNRSSCTKRPRTGFLRASLGDWPFALSSSWFSNRLAAQPLACKMGTSSESRKSVFYKDLRLILNRRR